MSAQPVPPLRSGIDVLSGQLLETHDALIVAASALHRGFAAPDCWTDARVNRAVDAATAIQHASGRIWGGQRTAVILEGRHLEQALDGLVAARDQGQSLVAMLWPDPDQLALVLRRAMESELTLLAARSMQEALDLAAVATLAARSTGAPCLVLGPAMQGPWSIGRFAAPFLEPFEQDAAQPLIDPSRPLSIGSPVTGRLALKQLAGRAAARPDASDLINQAMDEVARLVGRPLKAASGSQSSVPQVVFPACTAPQDVLDPSILTVTRLFPVPDRPATAAPTAVVLPAGSGSDPLHPLVRAFDAQPRHSAAAKSRFFGKRTDDAAPREPVTILAAPALPWTPAHLDAVHGALREDQSGHVMRVLDALLDADTRIPAIEEQVHVSRQAGFDPAPLDIPVARVHSAPAGLWIGSRHPEKALRWARAILEAADASAVGSPTGHSEGGDALVWIHLRGVALPDASPVILLPDSRILNHRDLRHHIPSHAQVWLPDHVAGQLPPWLATADRRICLTAEEADWATVWRHPARRVATVNDFRPVEAVEPEEHRTPDAAEDPARNRFLRTLGHLQDQDRLAESPVDEWILSGRIPPLVPRPNRWATGQRPLPRVVGEKCIGCAACWAVCPEAAITVRSFTVAELIGGALERAEGSFVHLPRLQAAWIQTAHHLVRADDLGQYRDAAGLLTESIERLLTSAGATGPKADAIRAEAGRVTAQVDRQDLIRTDSWFTEKDAAKAGDGLLLSMQVDPAACTRCGLCTEACPEEAIEEVLDPHATEAFRQLDRWPTCASERTAHRPGSLLTGGSASAVFRPGSTDRANLNRTALRLAIEAHAAATRAQQQSLVSRVADSLQSLEKAMQTTAQDQVRINDFAAFDQQLKHAAGNVSDVLHTLLNERSDSSATLADLSGLHGQLTQVHQTLAAHVPALILVDSLEERQTGLAPFPSNAFGIPQLHLDRPAASGAIDGLLHAWEDRLAGWARLMRTARGAATGTRESATSAPNEEDRAWAKAHVPRVLWLVDRPDSQLLSLVRSHRPVHVLWLDGGPLAETDPLWSVRDVWPLLAPTPTRSLSADDPTELLGELASMAEQGRGLTHILALDPARDGVAIEDLSEVLEMGKAAGLIAGHATPTATLADWMVRQERFQAHFRPLTRKEHASDQLPMAEWLSLDEKGRSRSIPVVVTGAGAQEARWIPNAGLLAQSERWWNRLHTADQPGPSVPAVPQEDGSPVIESREPAPSADTHAQLTERLLALSGFQHGGSSLQAWLAEHLAPTADEDA